MDVDINDPVFINYLFNPIHVVYSTLIFFINVLLLYVIIHILKLQTTELKLILFLSINEIVLCIDQLVIAITKLSYGYHSFDADTLSCQVHGFLISWMFRYEVILVAILALSRYFLIVHKIELSMLLCSSLAILFICIFTAICLYAELVGGARPIPSYIYCYLFLTPGLASYVINIVITILNIIPCWITTFCYFSVGWKVNKQLNLIKIQEQTNGNLEALQIIKKQKLKLIIQLTMVFFIYNVPFMFSYITYILKLATGYKRPPFFDAVIANLVHFSTSINPVVAISFQPDINIELHLIWVKFQAKVKNFWGRLLNSQW
ncbi:family A G protein-coupled receptor-like protein [Conidiobolus coronatus NRRL 28638]|uniref:Family A G protein-coupled receptor-like protein n=1 Tax=Conidiobolus coronatus (strain ATCC 28846 / CBS 209.66 / NRRL 28638) TaxID=796925 RepID=A0A137NRM5_CONC2|nr:family A G protein-coupled receptor-like protein [Conidiobolus coronatus NRRL 28638]|eukprot:KXN65395.1 family A G protein-coupled receptor-like protein [Conidiobolus coronatus NRRL 28638]